MFVRVVWLLLRLSPLILAEQYSSAHLKGLGKRNLFDRFFGAFPSKDYNSTSFPLHDELNYHGAGFPESVYDSAPVKFATTENPHKKVTLMQVEKENEESMMRQLTENKYKNSLPVVIFDPFRYPITFRSPTFSRFKKANTIKRICPRCSMEMPCNCGDMLCYRRMSFADEFSPMRKLTKRDRLRLGGLIPISQYSPNRTRNVWKLEGTQTSERGKPWGDIYEDKVYYDPSSLSDQERMYSCAEQKLNRLYEKANSLFTNKSNESLLFVKEFEGLAKRDTTPAQCFSDRDQSPGFIEGSSQVDHDAEVPIAPEKKTRRMRGRKAYLRSIKRQRS